MLKNALHRVVDAYKVTAFNCQVFRDNCMMTKTFPKMRDVLLLSMIHISLYSFNLAIPLIYIIFIPMVDSYSKLR